MFLQTISLLWGMWLGQLSMQEQQLPFNFELKEEQGKSVMIIHNASERIRCDELTFRNDSMFVRLPVFDSEFHLKVTTGHLSGEWTNYSKKDHPTLPFVAERGKEQRFYETEKATASVSGRWETWFDVNGPDSSLAIGLFEQKGNVLTGTYLTESGDHRFIEGVVTGNKVKMSLFDGAHAWLYIASLQDDKWEGIYYSGKSYQAPFRAKKNEKIQLRDPNAITKAEGTLSFSFPTVDSTLVSLTDTNYRNKVVVLQIMGSWCPNCMDETAFLSNYYKQHRNEGVEMIGLAFERNSEFPIAAANVKRLIKRYDVQYPVLIAGVSGKENVMKKLPALKDFFSFPTTVFIDRKGNVAKVYAGFSGPATGENYLNYQKEFEETLHNLLK